MGRKHRICKSKEHRAQRATSLLRLCKRTTSVSETIRVEIKEEAYLSLLQYRQYEGFEAGGVFTGSVIGLNQYRISKVSLPCTIIDTASTTGFERDAQKANDFIFNDYEASNHTRYYLGEWHTHPENNPTPSFVDINSIEMIYKHSNRVIDGVFLIIVGIKNNYYGFYDGRMFHKVTVDIV